MTDYMGMYNERFMKRAPQYGANARARTYQDYMRNIQAQRMAAGQTFGNLAMQQQNQSFYDRAMGRPPGLSGGMAQQFSNQMGAARSRQLGQAAQQRYQAFSDIAAQEAQANQFARAEAAAEQQFQAQELQLQGQRQAQAQQIMASDLTYEQKQDQLRNLGLSYGEIERLSPSAGAAAIGGGSTLLATGAVGIGGPIVYRDVSNLEAFKSAFKGDTGISNLVNDETAIKEALKAGPGQGGKYKVTLSDGPKEFANASDARTMLAEKTRNVRLEKKKLADQLIQGGQKKNMKLFDAKQKAQEALDDLIDSPTNELTRVNDMQLGPRVDKSGVTDPKVLKKYDKLTKKLADATKKAADAGVDDVAAEAAKQAGIKGASKTSLKNISAKAIAGKTKLAALKGAGIIAGKIFLAYLAVEGISMALTGTGFVEGFGNLISGKGYQTSGKKGLGNIFID
jgi:hypothetical protein